MSNGKRVKVPRLVRMHADQMHDIEEVGPGQIVALFGIDCASGDTFTDGRVNITMTSMFVAEPVIELAVSPKDKSGQVNFSKALNRFTKKIQHSKYIAMKKVAKQLSKEWASFTLKFILKE